MPWNGSANTPVARQWLSSRHMISATDTHASIEKLLEAVFSVRSVTSPSREFREQSRESLQANSQLRVAVAEARGSSGNQRKRNVRLWKPLPSSAVKTVTDNTSLCMIVICEV
jgi:hypothetical protein